MDRERPHRRRRKRGARLAAAYAARGAVILALILIVSLQVCGFLYIGERLFPPPDSSQAGETEGGEPPPGETGVEDAPSPPEPGEASFTVVLDAGHGGVQSGCEFEGVLEKDITLAVTLLVRDKLEDMGVRVILTRGEDADVSLDRRCEIANDAGADLFVSIHCNSFEDGSVSGLEGYYHGGEKGKSLAQRILNAAASLGVKTRNVKDADYQILRDTLMPSALMEIGFLSNPAERERLQTPRYQDTIALAVAEGVAEMLRAGG